ncbi:hypothetical protein C1645_823632 [Glomus cerebriforme]|uniref:Uncharacterized protein n=1 Tax=Glomus cerebriforme TaxID=658196 RepID=A0A397T508_9GLOM|nr:hypothetical protein C1645_823632 [Glomus cerebriforme]
MNGVDDTSMDPLYRRRIPTGHVSFDELYVKFYGDIPEEQDSRISQNESFESLYQKYHNGNADDRQRSFDDLYVKYADELQVFGGGDDSIDFVYTLIDDSSNVSDTSKHEYTSPLQTKSNMTFYQKTKSSLQKGNSNTPKLNTQQKIDVPLILPPVTNSPQKEISFSFSSEIKDKSKQRSTISSSFSPKSPIKRDPGKIQTRSSTRLNSTSSQKIPKIISNPQTDSSRILHNYRTKSSDSYIDDTSTQITPTNKSGKKLQNPIITIPEIVTDTLKYIDNNKKNNSKETNGVNKYSLNNHFDNDIEDNDDHPKKKVKLNRSKKA